MNTLQTIYSRKSVRGFTGDISQEQLDTLLKVAYAAAYRTSFIRHCTYNSYN